MLPQPQRRYRAAELLLTMAPAPLCAVVSLAFACTHGLANHWTSVRGTIGRGVFDWERAIPFIEWTIVPYLSICVFFAWSFFVDRGRQELARHVARLLLSRRRSIGLPSSARSTPSRCS